MSNLWFGLHLVSGITYIEQHIAAIVLLSVQHMYEHQISAHIHYLSVSTLWPASFSCILESAFEICNIFCFMISHYLPLILFWIQCLVP